MIFKCSADSLEISRPLAISLVTCSPPIATTFVYTTFSSTKTVIFRSTWDYFDNYEPNSNQGSQVNTQQSGFRYNPETGETIDMRTGEIIQEGGKKNK